MLMVCAWLLGGVQAATKSMIDPVAARAEMLRIKPASDALRQANGFFVEVRFEDAAKSARRAIALGKSLQAWSIERGARRLLGEIRVSQGRYKEALNLLPIDRRKNIPPYTDVNVALAYLKLNDMTLARRFYHPSAFVFKGGARVSEMPSPTTARGLETGIRYERGLNYFVSSRKRLALREFELANRLAPGNGLINYYLGMSLVHMGKPEEAKPYFRIAAAHVSGWMQADAKARI